MIIVLKKGATQQDIDKLTNLVTAHGVQVNPVIGTEPVSYTHLYQLVISDNPHGLHLRLIR